MKIAIFVAFSVVFGLLCIAQAAPEQKRDVASVKDLIREIKEETVNAKAQDDESDEALAQLFLKVLKKQAKAEGYIYEDADNLAQTEGFFSFFHKIGNFFRRAKTKLRNFGHKVRKFFHRKG